MLREARGALTALGLVVCALLLAVSVNFDLPGQPLLQSIRFHIAATLVVLTLGLLLSGAWLRSLLFIVVAGASVGQGALIILRQQESRDIPGWYEARPLLKLLSFNLLEDNTANGKRIADFIVASGADLVLLMEAGPVHPYVDEIAAAYPYRAGCQPGQLCDMLLFSKTPFATAEVQSLSQIYRDRLIVTRTSVGGVSFNMVAAHLVKPYFDDFAADERNRLRAKIWSLKGPLLLAGDFNAAAWSDNIERMSLTAELIPGPGYPATWPVEAGPLGVPIDNVFTRAPLLIQSVRALDDAMGSNHRGLWVEVSVVPGS